MTVRGVFDLVPVTTGAWAPEAVARNCYKQVVMRERLRTSTLVQRFGDQSGVFALPRVRAQYHLPDDGGLNRALTPVAGE